ncbi:hypothetical protein PFISCL1PPCAC_27984, partial [Pristionchus fissidentatus]
AAIFFVYISLSLHCVVEVKRQQKIIPGGSRTNQLRMRFIYSMSFQAVFTSILFVLPLAVLVGTLMIKTSAFIPSTVFPMMRAGFVVIHSCCSLGHSVIFLSRNAWFIQLLRGSRSNPPRSPSF